MSLHQPAPSALLWTASTDDGCISPKQKQYLSVMGKKNVSFPRVIYFKWAEKALRVRFSQLRSPPLAFFFLMSSDELQRLLSAIKSLISTSNLMSFHCTAVADRFRLRGWFANISAFSTLHFKIQRENLNKVFLSRLLWFFLRSSSCAFHFHEIYIRSL